MKAMKRNVLLVFGGVCGKQERRLGFCVQPLISPTSHLDLLCLPLSDT
jgi:hypothetical protein